MFLLLLYRTRNLSSIQHSYINNTKYIINKRNNISQTSAPCGQDVYLQLEPLYPLTVSQPSVSQMGSFWFQNYFGIYSTHDPIRGFS